uniref:methylmalonyl-CoA mutase family protein n=1 Tax=Fulvivirga sp. TaxID=1931237 RepID=UPI00404A4DFC
MSLFEEFENTTYETWLGKVNQILKGADIKSLNWSYENGIIIEPYYISEMLPKGITHLGEYKKNGSLSLIEFLPMEKALSAKAQEALNLGATGVFISAKDAPFESKFTHGILPEYCWFGCRFDPTDIHGMNNLASLLKERNAPAASFFGLASFDSFLLSDLEGKTEWRPSNNLKSLLSEFQQYPNFKTIEIRADLVESQGGTITQQLGFVIASLKSYLDQGISEGLTPESIFENLAVTMAVGTDFYHEISKLRAVRLLIYKVLAEYGVEVNPNGFTLLTTASQIYNSQLDSDNNYLRRTTQTMASILGGTDGIINGDLDIELPQEQQRINRNIANILLEESYLNKVGDPLAGSYFMENLTEKLSESAWNYFSKIEERGGIHFYLKSQSLWNDILANRADRLDKMYKRRIRIVGVNDYPNFKMGTFPIKNDDTSFRLASDYEKLHFRIENALANKTLIRRPEVLPILIGENAAMRSARQNFSANFLASGGFLIAEPANVESLNSETNECEIAVICGDDQDYLKLSNNEIALITSKAKLVLIAGLLGTEEEQFKKQGIYGFIHRKSNQFEILKSLMSALGIKEI